jgi:hypothetical protein
MTKRNKISYAQQALPFDGTGARALQAPLKYEWRAVGIAGASVLLIAIAYGYCVVTSIAHVSLREAARAESRTLAAERATLEGTYFEKTRGITLEYARSLGYTSASEKVFVTRSNTLSYAADAR